MEKRARAKKGLVGCAWAAAVAIILLGAVVTAIYLSIRRVTGPLVHLSAASAMEKNLPTADYRSAADGEVTESQLASFLAVETAVESRIGGRVVDLRGAAERVLTQSHGGRDSLSLRPTLDALGPVGPAFLDGKKAQIDALKRAGMSRDEFEWVRQQLYHAAGIDVWQLDFSDLVAGVPDAGITLRPLPHRAAGAPPGNRALVAPHVDSLQRWTTLAAFSL